jgi:hypothetical protein
VVHTNENAGRVLDRMHERDLLTCYSLVEVASSNLSMCRMSRLSQCFPVILYLRHTLFSFEIECTPGSVGSVEQPR